MFKLAFVVALATLSIAGQYTTVVGDQYAYTVSAMTSDPAGNTYVVGKRQGAPSPNLFVSKLDPNGTVLFTNFIGGTGDNIPAAVAVDQAGGIYVAGETTSADFPLSHACCRRISWSSRQYRDHFGGGHSIRNFAEGPRGRTQGAPK